MFNPNLTYCLAGACLRKRTPPARGEPEVQLVPRQSWDQDCSSIAAHPSISSLRQAQGERRARSSFIGKTGKNAYPTVVAAHPSTGLRTNAGYEILLARRIFLHHRVRLRKNAGTSRSSKLIVSAFSVTSCSAVTGLSKPAMRETNGISPRFSNRSTGSGCSIFSII